MGEEAAHDTTRRLSDVIPGRFGDPVSVQYAWMSPENAEAMPTRPLFLALHGWGSNERDIAGIMQYIAPYNDVVSLRAPLVLHAPEGVSAGAYSWFHDAVPSGDDLDHDIAAAARAVDQWVDGHIPATRDVVPIGFSQGGAVAVHLLRMHPERYRAVINLSGFLAPAGVPGTAPADDRLTDFEIPVYFGYGKNDAVIPKYELFAAAAWLEEADDEKLPRAGPCGEPGRVFGYPAMACTARHRVRRAVTRANPSAATTPFRCCCRRPHS